MKDDVNNIPFLCEGTKVKIQAKKFNIRSLQQITNDNNPVARIQHITHATNNNAHPTIKHFQKGDVNNRPFLCEGAKVKIQGKNFCPVWGLFNEAIGKIIKIVFNKDKNPNHGDHPDFIVINFPQYIGPTWDPKNKTVSILLNNLLNNYFI